MEKMHRLPSLASSRQTTLRQLPLNWKWTACTLRLWDVTSVRTSLLDATPENGFLDSEMCSVFLSPTPPLCPFSSPPPCCQRTTRTTLSRYNFMGPYSLLSVCTHSLSNPFWWVARPRAEPTIHVSCCPHPVAC